MKRVRCPKCDNYIIFDEKKYKDGQQLVFQCDECGKQFAIRMGVSKLRATQREEKENPEFDESQDEGLGSIVILENQFHFRQVLPLHMGDNIIGKYYKSNNIHCPIETSDPSIDLHHCVLNVCRDKKGNIKYVLRDGPSVTGTFVSNEILGDREKRIIEHGTLFTMGATSAILKLKEED